jgi:hypothetical protein
MWSSGTKLIIERMAAASRERSGDSDTMCSVDDTERMSPESAARLRRNLYTLFLPGLNIFIVIAWLAVGTAHHNLRVTSPVFALLAVGGSIYAVVVCNRLIRRETKDEQESL